MELKQKTPIGIITKEVGKSTVKQNGKEHQINSKIMKSETSIKPNISERAFWDVNFDKIDFEKSSVFVIDKVLNYGTFSEQIEIIKFYGIERVKNEVIKIPYFKKNVFAFVCGFLNLDKSLFTAYQRRQQQPNYWNY